MTAAELEDLIDLKTISTPVYHPLGNQFLYVENGIETKTKKYYASIYSYDVVSKESVCLVTGARNTLPVWNKEGSAFLFLSDKTGHNQVYVYELQTQQIKKVTTEFFAVKQVVWHPDSRQFFYLTTRKKTQNPRTDVFMTESIDYLANGQGLISADQFSVLCTATLDGRHSKELTTYSLGYGLKNVLTVSADGQFIIYEKRLSDDPFNQDSGLFRMNLATYQEEQLSKEFKQGMFGEPTISEGGRYIGTIGSSISYHTSNQLDLYVYDLKQQLLNCLTANFDAQISDFSVSDSKPATTNALLQWSNALKCFFTLVSKEGTVRLYRFSVEGEWEEYATLGPSVYDFALHPTKPELLACISSPECPSRVVQFDLLARNERDLFNPNDRLFSQTRFAPYQKFETTAEDGGRIPGYLVFPSNFSQEKSYPLIVNLHGGPYAMHAEIFHHEIQCMAAADYFVLLLNPRGSFGYGQAHLKGVVGKYGEGDYTDIMTAVEQVVTDQTAIDSERLFVTGGSYGGFMVNWIVTQTNRFKAAITQRSMSNFVSMIGTSDIGYYFFVEETDADILTPDKLWEKSPLAYVEQVNTPILVMHSEEDFRCPMEQAEQWYRALRYQKKEAKFIRFAHANHELSRSGDPALRIIRLQEMLAWFHRFAEIS